MQLDESLPLKTFSKTLTKFHGDRKGGQDPHGHAQDFDDILLFNELRSSRNSSKQEGRPA